MSKTGKGRQSKRRLQQRRERKTTPGTRPRKRKSGESDESRGAVALTVAWMLSLLATLLAIITSLASRAFVAWWDVPREPPGLLVELPELLQFIGAITGTLCLVLTAVAYRVRRHPPPRSITILAVLAASAAWLLTVW